MQVSGRSSWRASISSGSTLPHRALFIRDSCRLPVPPHPANPPQLIGEVADHSAELSNARLADAGSEWFLWWHEIVGYQVREASSLPDDPVERSRPDYAGYTALFDWPELSVLQSKPALRRAAQVSGEDALRFRNAAKEALKQQLERIDIPRPVAADPAPIAESLIERLHLSPGQLSVTIEVLGVIGDWSYRPLPGVLVCSMAVAQDDEKIVPLIEATFLSSIDAS